jgi:hypothetical protein
MTEPIKIQNFILSSFIQFMVSGIALGYGLDDLGLESRQGLGIFLLITASRPAILPN